MNDEQVVVDFKKDIREFPEFVITHFMGLAHANLTQFNDFALLLGAFAITNKWRWARSLGIYLLLWVYYRNRPVR